MENNINYIRLEQDGYKIVTKENLPKCFRLGGLVVKGSTSKFMVPMYTVPLKINKGALCALTNELQWVSLAECKGDDRYYTRTVQVLVDYRHLKNTCESNNYDYFLKEADEETVLREFVLRQIL